MEIRVVPCVARLVPAHVAILSLHFFFLFVSFFFSFFFGVRPPRPYLLLFISLLLFVSFLFLSFCFFLLSRCGQRDGCSFNRFKSNQPEFRRTSPSVYRFLIDLYSSLPRWFAVFFVIISAFPSTSLHLTGFYWVFTRFYWVLPSFTGF